MKSEDLSPLTEGVFVQELQGEAVLGRLGVQFLRLWPDF